MPKMKLGAAFYALIAVVLLVSAVLVLHNVGQYAELHGWPLIATAVVDGLAGLVFAVGAVTRRGLVADDGPWVCRNGWLIVVALTVTGILVTFLSDAPVSPFPMGPAVFVPHWVRRLQEKYYEGRDEAERELNPEEPDGVRPPTG